MRVTVSHNKSKAEVRTAIDRSLADLITAAAQSPIEIAGMQKSWSGDTMMFSFTAGMGFLKTPITGSVLVGDKDVTIDVDLGLLGNLIPEETLKKQVEGRVRGLLA
jgi:hypothetical protein